MNSCEYAVSLRGQANARQIGTLSFWACTLFSSDIYFSHLHHSSSPAFLFFIMAPTNMTLQSDDSKICVVMVGLPARGKSLIAGKGT